MKKKLESLKLKKFKMQTVKGGLIKDDPYTEDSYRAENSYNGTYYVNDNVKYD
ncbi:hypothetical protein [Chryseobacterium pennipullorum]|uniref:hypothetical protein n=1 Tax=Chryseobacterium pennipullorum TaxID=2258963 RepID=UPI0014024A62|nr:hypothetical protein [Chryseobacterium pennipullorum]